MKSPFLSIITINFNNCEGLKKTIESVLSQTFTDFEYIVIDGDSNDGSKEFLQTLDRSMIDWVCEKDLGIYNAMNKGIRKATGEYFLFLNSGDVLNGAGALNEFISHPKFDGDIIYGDYKFEDGYKIYPDTLDPSYFIKTSLPHQSTLFRSSVFEEMGHYDESYRMGADRAFFIKCYLSETYKFQHILYFLTVFDMSGISNDAQERELKLKEDTKMLKDLYGDDYERYKKEVEEELERNKVSKYSWKGILKRIKKRLNNL